MFLEKFPYRVKFYTKLYPAIWKADLTIFLHQRMDFTPKDRKTWSQKVKRDFVKKSALLYHISGEKTRPNNYTKRKMVGGDNLSIKGLYFKNTLRLAIFRAQL